MDKIEVNELLDAYGGLLTERQQDILRLYFEEDWSYHEIASALGISRAAVMDAVHRSVDRLRLCERQVGWLAKKQAILQALQEKDMAKIEAIVLGGS